MICLPLIERELRVALRKLRPAQARLKVAALAVAGSVLFLLLGSLIGSRSMGVTLEQLLCGVGLYFIIRTPGLTAGVLAEERRNQTLGLLFLTGLHSGEVFASKFLSSALVAFTGLLALFPVLALPFLLGGVPFDVFLATIAALPVLMFFALALSLVASALTRDDGAAVVLAFVLAVVLCALSPAIYLAQSYFSTAGSSSLWWWRLSPAYGPELLWRALRSGFAPGTQAEFWGNLAVTWSWSVLSLGAAAFSLKRLWREREDLGSATGWRQQWHNFLHGTVAARRRLADRWLELNPFVWLAARDRQPESLGWLVVGGLVLLWLLCWAAWPARWPSVQNFFITATVLNSTVAWMNRHFAAQTLSQGRRDGAYELLLTTPLNPAQIVEGALEALRWRRQRLAHLVLFLNSLLMLAGLLLRRWNGAALFEYCLIWTVLLTWSWSLGHWWHRALPVMWTSLNCGRAAHAVWRVSGGAWSWVWVLFNMRHLGQGFRTFPTGSLQETGFVLFFGFLWMVVWLSNRVSNKYAQIHQFKWDPKTQQWDTHARSSWRVAVCQSRLVHEFRDIVREPLPDPSDPRFRKWNPRDRYPWPEP